MRAVKRGLAATIAVLAVPALASAACGDGDDGSDRRPQARAVLERLDGGRVAARVAKLRELEFGRRLPGVRIVTPRQTVDFVRRQVERDFPRGRLEVEQDYLRLAGMLPADQDLRGLLDRFGSSLLVGYYDPRRPRSVQMVTVEESRDPQLAEAALAHELVHALQDREFDLRSSRLDPEDEDRLAAVGALVEGDATLTGGQYAEEFLEDPESGSTEPIGEDIPPALLVSLAFPYEDGAEFVLALLERGRSYRLLDRALRDRPPASTEQVLHPEKYFAGERPRAVRTGARQALGRGWRSTGSETFGELDALAILSTRRALTPGAGAAAAGWDGGRRELLERGGDRVLAIATTWESTGEAGEFARAYERSLVRDREARRSGGTFALPRGQAAAVRADGRDVRIAIAPDARLATRVAAAGAGST